MPLIHDEIATFFRYVHLGTFIPYHSEWSTNNHVLNSLLTWVSYKLFGATPIAQRLPNLFFIPVYFYFIFRISGKIENRYLQWGFLILMVTIHNYMDFFCLSRGYGISLAMMSGAIWFTWKALENCKTKHYLLSMIFMFLSVSAILIMVNSYILLIFLLGMNTVLKNNGNLKRMITQFVILIVMGVIPVIGTVIYLIDLNDVGRLDYGGMDGFWDVSVKNLTHFLVGNLSPILNILIIVLFSGMIIAFLWLIFRQPIRNFFSNYLKSKYLFFYLLTGNIIAFLLEHHLFGILYPEERTSIQFILFFFGSLIFLLDSLKIKKQFVPALVLIPFVFFPIQFVYSLNFERSPVDTFNYNIPESFYEKVQAAHTPGEFPPTVGGYALRIMKWNYFNFMKHGEESCIHFNGYPSLDEDFQIVIPDENPQWLEYYKELDTDRNDELHLLERKHKLTKDLLFKKTGITSDSVYNGEYFNFSSGNIDTLAGSTLYFGFKINIKSDLKPLHCWLVVTVFTKDSQSLRYEFIPLDWYRTDWSDPANTFINGQLVHELPEESYSYVAYIWNIYKEDYVLQDAEFSIFKLENDYK